MHELETDCLCPFANVMWFALNKIDFNSYIFELHVIKFITIFI